MIYQIEPFLVSMTSLPMFAFKVQDVNPFTRLGSFNLCLNLVWALLHVHPGSIFGSLSVFFYLLEIADKILVTHATTIHESSKTNRTNEPSLMIHSTGAYHHYRRSCACHILRLWDDYQISCDAA